MAFDENGVEIGRIQYFRGHDRGSHRNKVNRKTKHEKNIIARNRLGVYRAKKKESWKEFQDSL